MGLKNSTVNFSQTLSSKQGQLVRVEVLVLFSALIWVLLEMFGSRRRRFSHWFFRLFVWAVYTLFTVLAPYTIGLLQSGPFSDQAFVLWGTVLLLIQVSADSLSVYSIQDIEQRKRMLVQHMLQIFLVLWLIVNSEGGNKSYRATTWILWIQSVVLTYRKSATLGNASKKGGPLEQSKVIADYMMVEHEQIAESLSPNSSIMEGYRYIFHGEEEVTSLLPTAPEYRIVLKEMTWKQFDIYSGKNKVCSIFTTIDSVWRQIDDTQNIYNKETIKEVALSFTLFKLLKRRFCGYKLGEAGLPKTLDFVLGVLISENGNYASAFRVIEMELSFLYDFFYTRFDVNSSGYTGWSASCVIPTVFVWNFISGAFSKHYHSSNLEQRVNESGVRWITIVLLATWFIVLITETFVYPVRWILVRNLHELTAGKLSKLPWSARISPGNKKELRVCWERKIGQYPLLINFDYNPWKLNALSLLSLRLIEATRAGQKAGEKIDLSNEVIRSVLSGFKESNGHLGNGQSAVDRNHLGGEFSWACTLPTYTHMIMVWHIGTTMSMCLDEEPLTGDRLVAKSLSDYCSYLVVFVPDMLPDHGYNTQRIFDAVVVEAREILAGCNTLSSRCQKLMMMVLPDIRSCSIIELGARLGRELSGVVPQERRWKLLAEFWSEFILFLAPSSNTEIHLEKLAAGGEFMTHLWALLTHAGILDRPSTSSRTDAVGGNNHPPV